MENLKLVEPNIMYKDGFNLFFKDYKNSGEEFVPFVLKFYTNPFNYDPDSAFFSQKKCRNWVLVEKSYRMA